MHGSRGQAGVGAPHVRRDGRVSQGLPADMRFVDDRLVPGVRGGRSFPQRNRVSTTTATAHPSLARVSSERSAAAVPHAVPEHGIRPADVSPDRFRVRIHDDLVGIEPVPLVRLVRPVDPIAIELSGTDIGQIAVPDQVGLLAQGNAVRIPLRRPRDSNRHSSTREACAEKSAKFTPRPSQVAPSG